MNISENGLKLLKELENSENVGFKVDKFYPVKDFLGVWNIAYGHKIGGAEVLGRSKIFNGLTLYEANQLILSDISPIESTLNEKLVIPLSEYSDVIPLIINQNRFDALCIFIYNIGIKAFLNSHVYGFLMEYEAENACTYWLQWCHALDPITHQEVVVEGLENRRKKEVELFNS
jgi:lysozyme